ncbi:MAG: glycosyltransferase family 2 protein [Patescibacteria group bacterium]
MKRPKLSIIILNYNTVNLTRDCLASIKKNRNEVPHEIIVSDNGSTDGSIEMIKKEFPWVKLIENGANLGFAKGNNRARKFAKGKYVLFLNTDTIVKKGTLRETVKYMDEHPDVGALSCRLVLADTSLDRDARRGFPTPWVSLTHFSGLDKIFPNSRLLAKYWYGGVPEDRVQEVDVIQGAYFLSPKRLLDKVGWFDEDYFLDGEDIDLCWKITKAGYKIIYYPEAEIIHLKGATKGKNKKARVKVSLKNKIKFRISSVYSMEIFYRKRLWKNYPLLLNILVLIGIKCLKLARLIKLLLS